MSATSFWTPKDEPSHQNYILGGVIIAVAVTGLVLELTRPTSRIGWGMRGIHDAVRPPIQAVHPIAEKLKRLNIGEADIDIMVRTVIGEAALEPDVGKIAVAWVILNRAMQNVRWYGGNNVSNVALHKSTRMKGDRKITTWQFEPWMSRRDYLWNISKYSPRYIHVRNLVVGAINGTHADPTDGATHFLQPDIVKARTGGTLPSWARGEGRRIGNHVFFRH